MSSFALIFILFLMGMEYAQITFFRPFAIVPLIVMMVFADYEIRSEGGKQNVIS